MKMKTLLITIAAVIAINGYSQNGALNFDGTDDFVDVGNATELQITGAVTYEAWIRTTSSTVGYIFGRRSSDAATGMANDLVLKPGGNARFRASNGTTVQKAEGTSIINDGQWHHLAGVFMPGDSVLVYVDGVLDDQFTAGVISSVSSTSLPFQIGKPGGTATVLPFDGDMDEVRVWNVARTKAEINANMNHCLSGSEAGLVAYYNFEDGTGSSILSDLTINDNPGALTNMDTVADWTLSSPLYCCAIDTSVTVNADSLTSNANGFTYQWLDCDNNMAIISGETGQLFTPTASGNYAVEITDSSCVDTSACHSVTVLSVKENNFNQVVLYPNPTKGDFIVELNGVYEKANLSVINNLGQTVTHQQLESGNKWDISFDLPNGIYFVNIEYDNGYVFKKKLIVAGK